MKQNGSKNDLSLRMFIKKYTPIKCSKTALTQNRKILATNKAFVLPKSLEMDLIASTNY